MTTYIIFVVSLAVLIYGADIIINQSEKIAIRFGLSDYIISATLIALGTSLPEMAASIGASLHNKPELSVSNVIGSNILNITLVIGSVLLIAKKVTPDRDFFAKDSSWALFPVLIFIVLAFNGEISRLSGFALMSLMGGYILFLLKNNTEGMQLDEKEKQNAIKDFNPIKTAILLVIGFLLVIYGADYAVKSASDIAISLGVSEWFVGVILVAFGTSLPELIVSIVAALKGKADMAIGNIIGSNMANISIALGAAAFAHPINLNFSNYIFDIATLAAATLMLVFITANKMYSKPAGISLLVLLTIFFEHSLRVAS